MAQVITASRPERITPFTRQEPGRFRKPARSVRTSGRGDGVNDSFTSSDDMNDPFMSSDQPPGAGPGRADDPLHAGERAGHRFDEHLAAVGRTADVARTLEPVDQPGRRTGGEAGARGQLTRGQRSFQVEQAERVPLRGVQAGPLPRRAAVSLLGAG
jgi:hypothetical protein